MLQAERTTMATVGTKVESIELFEKHRGLWVAKLIAFVSLCLGVVALAFGQFDRAVPLFVGWLCVWLLARESGRLCTRVDQLEFELDRLREKPIA
jgi:hypothetical protein